MFKNQNKQEWKRLTAELTNAQPSVEDARKACNDTVKELAEKAEEIKALEKKLGVVIGLIPDLGPPETKNIRSPNRWKRSSREAGILPRPVRN